ncbi:MAG TPA: hypothetical protein VGR69_02225 [Candidatus Rubrimentiphilum sp.]|nr:hypothetical protein [Candidatus Rubrimentiphilum sp.]
MEKDPTTRELMDALLDFQSGVTEQFSIVNRKLLEHDRRFDSIDAKLLEHDRRFEAIDRRVGHIETRVEDLERRLPAY